MIGKQEIIDSATILGLNPHVVEKDYVLGWLLWGISQQGELADNWVFKGGTCLKKCFFETYRFSEDLDFTLKEEGHLDADFLYRVFSEICERIYDQSGIELPRDYLKFDIYENPRGTLSCEGKLGYRGPVSPPGKNMPRIKLDLTADEVLAMSPVTSTVFHPYSDEPDDGIHTTSYAYEEVFAEKTRALAERTRPRDLYDVVNLFRNQDARPDPVVFREALQKKCEFKNIPLPTLSQLEPDRRELEASWNAMLRHQLPKLPDVESYWQELPAFFDWIESGTIPVLPEAYALGSGEATIRSRTMDLPISNFEKSSLQVIRFAAANRLCVDLVYQGSSRRIEPYSLRRTKDNNIILHAHNVDKNEHRSYRLDRIQSAEATDQSFVPRHAIELTPSGYMTIPLTTRKRL